MQIVLYYAPNACSLVPYVTLTEAGAAFEVRTLNMRKEEQRSAAYMKLIRSTRCRCSWSTAGR